MRCEANVRGRMSVVNIRTEKLFTVDVYWQCNLSIENLITASMMQSLHLRHSHGICDPNYNIHDVITAFMTQSTRVSTLPVLSEDSPQHYLQRSLSDMSLSQTSNMLDTDNQPYDLRHRRTIKKRCQKYISQPKKQCEKRHCLGTVSQVLSYTYAANTSCTLFNERETKDEFGGALLRRDYNAG